MEGISSENVGGGADADVGENKGVNNLGNRTTMAKEQSKQNEACHDRVKAVHDAVDDVDREAANLEQALLSHICEATPTP